MKTKINAESAFNRILNAWKKLGKVEKAFDCVVLDQRRFYKFANVMEEYIFKTDPLFNKRDGLRW